MCSKGKSTRFGRGDISIKKMIEMMGLGGMLKPAKLREIPMLPILDNQAW